jgi:hypothetical protein
MTDDELPRWRGDPDVPPEIRRAIESANRVEPAPEVRARLRARLVAPSGSGGARAESGGARAGSGAARAALIGATLAAGAVVLGVVVVVSSMERPPSPGTSSQPSGAEVAATAGPVLEIPAAAPRASAQAQAGDPVEPTPATSAEPRETLARPRSPRAPAHETPGPSVETSSSVASPEPAASPDPDTRDEPPPPSELALLEAARSQVRSAPLRAMTSLDRHRLLYPRGVFAEERDALEVEVLIAAGRDAEARARAQRLLSTYPGTAHRARLLQLVRQEER